MTQFSHPGRFFSKTTFGSWLLALALIVTAALYWPGLSGGFLFDDYPNIVDNTNVQPHVANIGTLVNAALASPASEFKRPLASLSFAVNYLATGLDPYWMKLTNLVIHLLNGWLVYRLALALLQASACSKGRGTSSIEPEGASPATVAAFIAAGWMLLPINLTCVLYVVQRMESLANLFVLLGLIGYVAGRSQMLTTSVDAPSSRSNERKGFGLCVISITVPTAVGLLAKETAVMLPLYGCLVECSLLGFQRASIASPSGLEQVNDGSVKRADGRLVVLFLIVLLLPMAIGMAWLLPSLLQPGTWATRDFTMGTRLLSEARIIIDYIYWTLLPTPDALSFYHDDFVVSKGLLAPWTTAACILALSGLIALAVWFRRRKPLVTLGIAFFLGSQLLTATILPLELVYEHRNYFASFGLLLAIVPPLVSIVTTKVEGQHRFATARATLLIGLLLLWGSETALTARSWGNPLKLAQTLAQRGPFSPRAQYELGRTYIIYSHYDPASPFTTMAYAPLERAAAIPGSSILPEQALIFMNSRMGKPLKDAWWNSMAAKLKTHTPTVQDESSLQALTTCTHDQQCKLPREKLQQAYLAALSHPDPSARLVAMYSDFAWNVMEDHALGLRMAEEAVGKAPNEPAYRITLIRMLAASNRRNQVETQIEALKRLNIGGRLNSSIAQLQNLPSLQ